MTISKAWILLAFCFAPHVACSQDNGAACDLAAADLIRSGNAEAQLTASLNRAIANLTDLIQNVINDNVKAERAIDDFCEKLNVSAQAGENVISRCSPSSQECSKHRQHSAAPDVLRALATFCRSIQAVEYIPYMRTLATCQTHFPKWPSVADAAQLQRIAVLLFSDVRDAWENATVSCGFVTGRKSACRGIQAELTSYTVTGRPNGSIREVCGQNVHDLVLELQERLLNALHCSEFGDYVREWGWLKVNYRANKTMPVHHR